MVGNDWYNPFSFTRELFRCGDSGWPDEGCLDKVIDYLSRSKRCKGLPPPRKVLGYGSFGVVYSTTNKLWILKITTDPEEVEALRRFSKSRYRKHFPKTLRIVKFYKEELWFIWKERCDLRARARATHHLDKILPQEFKVDLHRSNVGWRQGTNVPVFFDARLNESFF